MPKRRTSKHRGPVKDCEAAWLRGDREAGFFYACNHPLVRQELWDRAGDHGAMFWKPDMRFPEPIDEMKDAEC
jgi:hypothetical protein